ncbi:MAG: Chromosome (plasmid) partitioning protein ParA / Sporulation initiation inhibitor protein Soj [uncultured Thermomicrobiales bacterium]|uniref:Chromosome (Plasmid) partitioning protein ParA / Sporulation initiation inhibitor protein Soj n=1 Tax=uncultured Thermomicrobiales bacterium TaxID=1645740 RepID=A0A6J4V2B7_9BACT|nr:MAG: Chromosome (plasmid) partitioning protein ParA / Sporulation initiation inhibitor protein Soj [uncultured Thermomicrobiales bacterium]
MATAVGAAAPAPSGAPAAAVVALANQKGGVGKTTTAVNAAVGLARRGYRVLLVDMDPQGNATSSLGVEKAALLHTVYDVLVDEVPIARAVAVTDRPNLDLVASTPTLAGAEIELVEAPRRERRLAHALAAVADRYHVVLIDCPPSLGLLTVNALTAARSVVVPIQCEFLALEGVGQLITTIDLVKRRLNPPLDVAGVLMTMFDARTRLSAHVVEEVRRYFPQRIFRAVVPRSVRLAEAPSYGQGILEYDPASRGATAYEAFVDELVDRLKLAAVGHRPSTADPGWGTTGIAPASDGARAPVAAGSGGARSR